MLRKFVLCLLAFCLLGTVASGCSQAPETPPATTAPAVSARICLQLPQVYQLPVQQALEKEGHWVDAQTEGCQLLITTQLPDPLPDCPAVLVDARSDGICSLVCDRQDLAARQVEALAALPYGGDMNRDGVLSYAIISPTGTDYTETCQQALFQSGIKTQQLSVQSCKDDAAVAAQVCGRLLASYGKDLDVLFCGSQVLTEGTCAAIKDNGRRVNEDLVLLCVGTEPAFYSATVYADPAHLATLVCDYARQLLAGQQPPALTQLPVYTAIAAP